RSELQLSRAGPVEVTVAPMAGGGLAVSLRQAGRERRDQALGLVVREAIARRGGQGPGQGMQLLAGLGRRVLPGSACLIAVVGPDQEGSFRAITGAGAWAERLVGKAWPLEPADGEPLDADRSVVLRSSRPETGDGVLGLVAVRREKRRPFSKEEQEIIDDFAAVVAASLQRADLRTEARLTSARLQAALDVALDLAASL